MINIHRNNGDVINFRFIGADNQEMVSATNLVFSDKPQGTFAAPFAIETGNASSVSTVAVGQIGISYEDGNFIINGDMSDVKSVEIFDLTGKLIAKSTGEHKLNIGNIDGSVVTVVIRKADSSSAVKMIIK